MPKHEIGRKVFAILLLAIAGAVAVALVALGAKDVVIHMIDAITRPPMVTGMEGITS